MKRRRPSTDGDGDGPSNEGKEETHKNPGIAEEDDYEEPQLLLWVAVLILAVATAMVGLCANALVKLFLHLKEPAQLTENRSVLSMGLQSNPVCQRHLWA